MCGDEPNQCGIILGTSTAGSGCMNGRGVDLSFALNGSTIPVDHGYAVYAAISKVVPTIHGDNQIGIHPIYGRLAGNRKLAISKSSRLVVRLPSDRLMDVLPLAGKTLDVGGGKVVLGVPTVQVLVPAASLSSRLVVIKGFMEPEPFREAVQRQLDVLAIQGRASLVSTEDAVKANADRDGGTKSPWVRRTLRIRDKEIVGFAVRVEGLTAEEAILLQERGVGGRRRFGCGIFVAVRG